MRVLVESYGDIRIFYDRPFGYKRYHVEWDNGRKQLFSGIWYSEKKVKEIVENEIQSRDL